MHTVDTIEYKHHTITIYHDEDTNNPLTDFNDDVCALIKADRYIEEINGGIQLPALTREHIKAHSKDILSLLEQPSFTALNRDTCLGYTCVVDLVNDALYNHYHRNISDLDKLDFLGGVLTFAGIAHINTSGSGYVQGAYHEILIVLSESADADDYGDVESYLQGCATNYRDYRYGDVHGYQITKGVTCECCGNTEQEEVGSCWGFSGEQGSEEWEYMISQAKAEID